MALERENECFFEREKKRERGGKDWMVLCQPRCLWAVNKTRKCWSFLHICLSLGQSTGPQAPSPQGGSASLRHNLAQSSFGAVLFGLLTRMFAYTSQVILSPSVVFWGSKTNVGDLPVLHSPDLSGSDLLSQALGVKPRLVPGGWSGSQIRAHGQWHLCPFTAPRGRMNQPAAPDKQWGQGTAVSPEPSAWR